MEKLNDIIFYALDKSIRSYRQYAQKQLKAKGFDITIDQWLVLKCIQENEAISQQQIAASVFKDVASVTRIIELLVKNEYLTRSFHSTDRRRFELKLTDKAVVLISKIKPYTEQNRTKALQGLTDKDIKQLHSMLQVIIENVTEK